VCVCVCACARARACVCEGSVVRHVDHGHEGLLVLSQQPYLTDSATLRQQVTTLSVDFTVNSLVLTVAVFKM